MQTTHEQIMEIEDFLQAERVFLGRSGEPAHMDSYGTVVDFNRLLEVWPKVTERYPAQTLFEVMNYWQNQSNSVCARIIGSFLLSRKEP